ncbi:protein-methionine-sulfoxide reductase catalytic subunit MsrP [Pseudocolwellia sp. AS88]|jgi:sulfoxide reductase catalytic subunit YedY|uniref:protein-methionine-sulfoxide reductase catalytic subunit MsrP n=1 Tax=Pseudocolwellia sp. AS88 TaxID=3063958 RepID=UPI0026F365AA|nr:protein-methionine-sulfoxide reductase catalytic subunit MsrP [Pseudocolwellia sp. AS88]MDO7086129.1 protein-methionine-sulfoxide reductase catalytic subunit MsrP [Pseudocolwellia sp. AS88]
MLIKSPVKSALKENEVTDESVYNGRRSLLKSMGFIGAGTLLSNSIATSANAEGFGLFSSDEAKEFERTPLKYTPANVGESSDVLTPESKVISHNNFYEFGTNKSDPVNNSQGFKVEPWSLKISGEVNKPFTLDYDDLFNKYAIEERIYRLRCVEAWSMVVPWLGFSLADIIKQADPTSKAKYVAFETLDDPKQMPGQRSRRIGGGIDFPYVEGLRIDEAMNPLTFMSVGLYGKTLAPQNGAPIRLVVPWKYGFKSIKSIVSIKLVEKMPPTTWNILGPSEYGFYANVNPDVSHPRWSQASERRITGGGLFARNRIETLPFNGYSEEVAHMYKDMDLRKYY